MQRGYRERAGGYSEEDIDRFKGEGKRERERSRETDIFYTLCLQKPLVEETSRIKDEKKDNHEMMPMILGNVPDLDQMLRVGGQ